MGSCYLTYSVCISLLQDYNAFNNRTLEVEKKFHLPGDNFYWYASEKYECNVTRNVTDECGQYYICGDPSYYGDLFWYPAEVTKGFLTNDDEEIKKSKVALIEQIALYSNYNLTTKELEICLNVSLCTILKKDN